MSPHRLALAGILGIFVALIGAGGIASAAPEPPKKDSSYVSPLVTRALQDLDTYQGQCWQWVSKLVAEVSTKKMGFDYREGYFEAGAVEVSIDEATSGDVIQIANDRYTAPDADYEGLHTLIITKNKGGGVFDGIDSNQNYDGVVHLRSNYSPADQIKRYPGLNFHIYRFPIAGAPKASGKVTAPVAQRALAAGDKAVVTAQGDGLNLRSGAGTDFEVVTKLPDGTIVAVLSLKPLAASGREWVQVVTPFGTGWVASEYLKLQLTGAPASGAGGSSRPLLPFRAFAQVVSN